MRIAEIYIEKKSNIKKIKLTFSYNQDLIEKIKTIMGRIYLYNSKTWLLPYDQKTIKILSELDFNLIDSNFLKNYELKIENILITNNYIIVLADEITKYILSKQFTFLDMKPCFGYGKFDLKKAKKIELFYMDDFHIYISIGFKEELFKFLNFYKSMDDWHQIASDLRKKRKFKYTGEMIKNCLDYITLRDYQIEAVITCFSVTMGVIKLLPGTGKTEIFLALCKLMNIKTLILTNSIDLVRQTYERGEKAKLDVGIVQGQNIDENHQIVMVTIQSSHKLKNKYEMVIIDECHIISLEQYSKILSDKHILYRFGFSATPLGKDKCKNAIVKQWIGDIIYTVESKQLQEKNRIAIPNINIYNINKPRLDTEFDFRNLEKIGIINNDMRKKIIIDICEKEGQKLILVKKVGHGVQLQFYLYEQGIKSEFLHGGVKKQDRTDILKEFDKNKNEFVLIGCKVLKQGISLENVNHLILAGGGSSYYETIQQLGRGLRSNTKKTVEIYDFMDNINPILIKHSNQRIGDFKKEGFDNIKYL